MLWARLDDDDDDDDYDLNPCIMSHCLAKVFVKHLYFFFFFAQELTKTNVLFIYLFFKILF